MNYRKRHSQPLGRILLSKGYERVLRLLGDKIRNQISAELNANYENQIADFLKENSTHKSPTKLITR